MDYLYLSGESSALMNTLLPREVLLKLTNADNYQDALDILKGTTYGSLLQSYDVEEALSIEQNKLNDFILNECPDINVTKFFLLPYDYDNLEVVCKSRSVGLSEDSFLEVKGLYDFDFIKESIGQKAYKRFNNDCIRQMLIEYNRESINRDLEAKEVDYIFQSYKFKDLGSLFKKGLMKDLSDFMLDYENISIAFRCDSEKELESNVLPFGKVKYNLLKKIVTRSQDALQEIPDYLNEMVSIVFRDKSKKTLAKYELLRRKIILKIIEPYLYDASNESTFVYYVYSKIFEIENLHLIMNLHKKNMASRIRSRLII